MRSCDECSVLNANSHEPWHRGADESWTFILKHNETVSTCLNEVARCAVLALVQPGILIGSHEVAYLENFRRYPNEVRLAL